MQQVVLAAALLCLGPVLASVLEKEQCKSRMRVVGGELCGRCAAAADAQPLFLAKRLFEKRGGLFERRALPIKRRAEAAEDLEEPTVGLLPIKRFFYGAPQPLPLKRAPLPLKRAPLPLKRAPLPLKRAPLPLKRAPLPLKRSFGEELDLWERVEAVAELCCEDDCRPADLLRICCPN